MPSHAFTRAKEHAVARGIPMPAASAGDQALRDMKLVNIEIQLADIRSELAEIKAALKKEKP